ncbi:TatD family hydrolase [Desulforudis sp. 1088]|uniref:TatD family hydrolase n=2 Tax=Candidatus Desulforudis TaxID=471826 RepID=UPI003CE46D3D
MLVDTHCHLDDASFAGDLDEVISRARQAGVAGLVTIGSDMASSRKAVEIAEAYPGIRAAVGVHPHDAARAGKDYLDELRTLAAHPKIVAIGEIGLDYHYDHSPRGIQREVFRAQLLLARELGLPVVVHCREAEEDTLAILKEAPGPGVMHCFTGNWIWAEAFLGLGCYISISGVVTFAKSADLKDVARRVPAERLLLETDAPYLAPVPRRGRRNEPAFLPYTAAVVAELRRTTAEKLAALTTANALRFFGIKEGEM